jgi:hypothetical protein
VFLVEDYVLYGVDLIFAEQRWTLVGRHEMVLLFRRKESNKEAALLARALLALKRRGKRCGHALFGLHLSELFGVIGFFLSLIRVHLLI